MIIGGWIWRLLRERLVTPYNPTQAKSASYDVHLGQDIIIYRLMGEDLPGVKARLFLDHEGHPFMSLRLTSEDVEFPALFDTGDIFLGETVEYFRQPRGISLKFMLKSSQARNFLEHLHAGFGEAGFEGKYTLEFQTLRKGYLYGDSPVGQMIPQLTLGFGSYARQADARYRKQEGVTASKNKTLAFRPAVRLDSVDYNLVSSRMAEYIDAGYVSTTT